MRSTPLPLIALALLGCVGEDIPPITPIPSVVPLETPALTLSAECVPRAGDVLDVSPEGDLWLAQREGAVTTLTARAADGTTQTYEESRDLRAGVALSATELAFVTDGVFIRDDAFVDSVPWPSEATGLTGLCGDPRRDRDGFVIADDLFQRSGGEWWRWRPAMGAFGDIVGVPRNLGACRGERGESWLVTSMGLWRIDDLGLERVEGLPQVRAAAFGPGFGAAAITADGLYVGPDRWVHTGFEAGEPRLIAASGATMYVLAGERLYRFDDPVVELDFPHEGTIEALHPYASGLWVETTDSLCDVHEVEPLVVRGLRPLERRGLDPLMLDVTGPPGALTILRDGEMVHEETGFSGDAAVLGVQGGEAGWHTLSLRISGERPAARELRYEVVRSSGATWVDDIEPLAAMHCAGSECHGTDRDDPERPDLTTYEGWADAATAIRNRVGVTSDMPPFDSRLASWDSEEATLIVAWIDEGMVRGQ